MRKSRYTVSVDGAAGEHLLYNTAFGTFAVLDDDTFAAFEAGGGSLEEQLFEDCFLTNLSPEEELAAQNIMFEAGRKDPSELHLSIAPTYACNFRCPYCYELGHNGIKGKMGPDVISAICDFVESRHRETGFSSLSVQWYGGDPSLALDVVESLSNKLIDWCDQHDVAYDAMMLTNCNAIDEAAADMLVRARVGRVYMTIDGFEETHNKRRVSAVGSNSFQKNMEAARLFVDRGITVTAAMNVDKVNWPEYHPLRSMLREEFGIDLAFARLCDYGHFFGTRDFKKPDFDLFEHEEYCRLQHEEFVSEGCSAEAIGDLLRPVPRFCNGQRDNYFVIDTLGDVYLCDGVIGEQDKVAFNILEKPTDEQLHMVSHDPYESEQCRRCHLLPICQGNCNWERKASDMACHPLLTVLPEFLRDYRECFGEISEPYVRLA